MPETRALYVSAADIQAAEGLDAWAAGLRRRVQILHDDLWHLIDYIGDGYDQFGDAVFDYADEVGLSIGRMRSYNLTAHNFSRLRRANLPELSPAHYEVVNSLQPDDQERMLQVAHAYGLSRDELRAQCREERLTTSREPDEVRMDNHYLEARVANLERDLETARAQVDSYQATSGVCPVCQGRLVCEECGGKIDV